MEIKGNNMFGSKGTIRCIKCQRRKGKVGRSISYFQLTFQCVFNPLRPELPCDYCFARSLVCGLKYPTPRKLREQGILALPGIQYAAIGQPLTPVQLGQMGLRVQTAGIHDDCLLSSGMSGSRSPFTPPTPTTTETFPEYTATPSYSDHTHYCPRSEEHTSELQSLR